MATTLSVIGNTKTFPIASSLSVKYSVCSARSSSRIGIDTLFSMTPDSNVTTFVTDVKSCPATCTNIKQMLLYIIEYPTYCCINRDRIYSHSNRDTLFIVHTPVQIY